MADSKPMSLLTLDNPVFCNFIFWSGVLGAKMMLMSLLTTFNRMRYRILEILPEFTFKWIFPNPEDAAMRNVEVKFDDPNVERVRRAHRNDMENILPYFTLGLLYICTDPSPTAATVLFRIATIARILHTLVYAFREVPQPSRAICFAVHYIITIYFACAIMLETLKYI